MPVLLEDHDVKRILAAAKRIAVPGLSDKPWRDSYSVTAYMLAAGYSVIPVNPNVQAVFGIPAVPSLSAITGAVDIVNVFRKPVHLPGLVEEMIARGFRTLWLQPGTVHQGAVARASADGIDVIADRCIRVAHTLLLR